MSQASERVAELFSDALEKADERAAARERVSRRILGAGGAFDRIAPTRLLLETVERHLGTAPLSREPLILFMDFAGGGDGARAASALLTTLGALKVGGELVYVAANTPPRGLGALIRTTILNAGAGAGIAATVVAHNRSLGSATLSDASFAEIADRVALAIAFASGGAAATFGATEARLLELSHASALSTPDPESFVADLPVLAAALSHEHRDADGLTFRVEVDGGDEGRSPAFEHLGSCSLGAPDDDAGARLWQLIDNAKRHRYRVVLTPTHGSAPSGAPIVCPCRTLLEKVGHEGVSTLRIVPSGNRIVTAGRGRKTLL